MVDRWIQNGTEHQHNLSDFYVMFVQAAADETQQQLESTLQATTDLLTKTMEAATVKNAELQTQKAEHSKQVEALQTRLQEAAGALNAKDELRECRCAGRAHTKLRLVLIVTQELSLHLLCGIDRHGTLICW